MKKMMDQLLLMLLNRRQEIMKLNHQRREVAKAKLEREKNQLYLIHTEEELLKILMPLNPVLPGRKSLILYGYKSISEEYHQKVRITFSKHGKNRPLTTIITSLLLKTHVLLNLTMIHFHLLGEDFSTSL